MFKHFINLELKAFFRSASVKALLKILMGFSSLFSACFLVLELHLPSRKPFLIKTASYC
jgi:hypothetical protein